MTDRMGLGRGLVAMGMGSSKKLLELACEIYESR